MRGFFCVQLVVGQRHLVVIRNAITFAWVSPAMRMFDRHHRRPCERIAHRASRVHHRIRVLLGRSWHGFRTFVVEARIGRHTHLHKDLRFQITEWIVGFGGSLGIVTRLYIPWRLGRANGIDRRISKVRGIGIKIQLIAR